MTGINLRAQRGFTLIELLVVIGIIAILAAIIFSVFVQTRGKARQTAGEMNIRQVSLAVLQYMQDNDEKGPRAAFDCESYVGGNTNMKPGTQNQCGGDSWANAVAPYIKNKAVFTAPGDESAVDGCVTGNGCGNNFTTTDGNFSLLYNDRLSHKMPTKDGYSYPPDQEVESNGIPLSVVKTPSDCVLLMEGHGGWDKVTGRPASVIVATDWTGSTDLQNKWHHEYTISVNFDGFMSKYDYQGISYIRSGLPFYNNGGNVAFVDGHSSFKVYCDSSGKPALCKSLPWTQTIDPSQVGYLDNMGNVVDSCHDPNNPLGAGYDTPNWF
jgi:prepilin-type N-terminal cleavage/methylation domain-containing protein/prepilin-type processing-associated H-X9-DG protein